MSADPRRPPSSGTQQTTSAKSYRASGLHLPRPAPSTKPIDNDPESPDVPLASLLQRPKAPAGPAPGTSGAASYSAPFHFPQGHYHPLRPTHVHPVSHSAPAPPTVAHPAQQDTSVYPTLMPFGGHRDPFTIGWSQAAPMPSGAGPGQSAPSGSAQPPRKGRPIIPTFVAHDEPRLGRLKQNFIGGEEDASMYLQFVDAERYHASPGAGVDALLMELINEYFVKKQMYRAAYGVQQDALQEPYTTALPDEASIKTKVTGRAPIWPDSQTGPLFEWFSEFCHERLFPTAEKHAKWTQEGVPPAQGHDVHDVPVGQQSTWQSTSHSRTSSLSSDLDRLDLATDRGYGDTGRSRDATIVNQRTRFEDHEHPPKRRRRDTVDSHHPDATTASAPGARNQGERPPLRRRAQTTSAANEEHQIFILPGVKDSRGGPMPSSPMSSSGPLDPTPHTNLARRQTIPTVPAENRAPAKRPARKRVSGPAQRTAGDSSDPASSSSSSSSGRRRSSGKDMKGKGKARELLPVASTIDPARHGYYHPPDTAGRWPGFNAADFYKPLSDDQVAELAAGAIGLQPPAQQQPPVTAQPNRPQYMDAVQQQQDEDQDMDEEETTPRWNQYLNSVSPSASQAAHNNAGRSATSAPAVQSSTSAQQTSSAADSAPPPLTSSSAYTGTHAIAGTAYLASGLAGDTPSTLDPNAMLSIPQGLTPLLASAFPPNWDWQGAYMQQTLWDYGTVPADNPSLDPSLFTPPSDSS